MPGPGLVVLGACHHPAQHPDLGGEGGGGGGGVMLGVEHHLRGWTRLQRAEGLVIVRVSFLSVWVIRRSQEYLFPPCPCSTEQHIGKAEPKGDPQAEGEEEVL